MRVGNERSYRMGPGDSWDSIKEHKYVCLDKRLVLTAPTAIDKCWSRNVPESHSRRTKRLSKHTYTYTT